MNVSRSWVCLLLLSACVRQFDPVTVPEAPPAFLGDASGLYIANHRARSLAPRTVVAVELQGKMLLAVGNHDSLDDALILTGDVTVDDAGVASFTQTLQVSANSVLPDVAQLFPSIASTPLTVAAFVTIGFDSLVIRFEIQDTSGRQLVCDAFSAAGIAISCAELGQAFIFDATKLCDFDARLAGVYNTSVNQVGGPAACSAFTGQREWVVVVANALPIGMVISVNKGELEHGAVIAFEPQTLSLTSTASALDVSDEVSTTAKLSIDATATRLRGSMSTGSGCRFDFDGVRATGTKSGLLCTTRSLCDGLAYAACPPLPLGLDGIYEFEGEFETQDRLCPVPICKLTLRRDQACHANAPALTQGCPDASSTVLLASNTGAGEACYAAGCAPMERCAALAQISALYEPSCNNQTFVVRNVGGCVFTTCPAR